MSPPSLHLASLLRGLQGCQSSLQGLARETVELRGEAADLKHMDRKLTRHV